MHIVTKFAFCELMVLTLWDRNAVGAILVIDITQDRSTTFQNVKRWLRELRSHSSDDVVTVLAGNKTDLRESLGIISRQDGEDFCRRHNLMYLEASALTGENVNELFETLVNEIYKIQESDDSLPNDTINVKDRGETTTRCCQTWREFNSSVSFFI